MIFCTTLQCIVLEIKGRMKHDTTCVYPHFFHFQRSCDPLTDVLQNEASHETFMERIIFFIRRMKQKMLRITYLFPISILLRPFPIKWYEKLVSSRLQKKSEYLSFNYWSFVSVSFYKEKEIAGNEETVSCYFTC